jgi:anthranilate/para-aminobenzoate synthase component II
LYLIVDNHDSRCVNHLAAFLDHHGESWTVLDRAGPVGELDQSAIRGVFLSGSDDLDLTMPVTLGEITADLLSLIELDAPVFGICMGFELIVTVFGSALEPVPGPLPAAWVPVNLKPGLEIFRGLPGEVAMPEFNRLRATAAPPGFEVVAWSGRSDVEAIVHRHRPIFATQFHPEAEDDQGRQSAHGLRILSNFLDLCRSRHERGQYCARAG